MIRFLQKDNATQRTLMIVFLGIVCLSMVIFMIPGVADFGNPKSTNVYAKVGDEEITVEQIDREALQIAQSRIQGRGDAQQYATLFRSSAATQLVSSACLRQEAHRVGLEVSDTELTNYLKHGQYGQAFFPNGVFIGEDAYESKIDYYFHVPVTEFEKQVKEEILSQKLAALVSSAVIVSPAEAADQYKSEHTKVKLEYAVFDLNDLKQQINPSEADLRKYYDEHKQEFAGKVPETRKVNYVVINSTTKLPAAPQVSDADIQRYYDQNKTQFTAQEQVRARHILFEVKPGGSTDAEALKKATDLVAKLRAGADFAAMAKQYSDDTGSKQMGGELGPFGRGQMVKPFEDAAFSLPVGKISDPIKSEFGYHIIQVEEKMPAGTRPLEVVKSKIADLLNQNAKQNYTSTFADKVEQAARKDGLAKAATDNELPVVSSGDLNQGMKTVVGVGNAPDFISAVFQNEPNSAPVEVKIEGGYAILQVVNKQPARDQTFEEAQANIQNILKTRMAREQMVKRAKDLSDRAHALNDFDAAAKELGAEVKTATVDKSGGTTSSIPGIGSIQSQTALFSMKAGDISGVLNNNAPTRPGMVNPGGETAEFVAKVVDRQEPSADEIKQNADKTRDVIYEQRTRESFELFKTELAQQMEDKGRIKYNEEVRKQIDKMNFKL